MITAWTKQCETIEDKNRFTATVQAARPVLERAKAIMKEMEADLDGSETQTKSYDNPNWAYLQADKNGFRRCLKALDKLFTLDQG